MLMDLDIVIMDHSVRLEEFSDPHFDGIITQDLNSGVFFLRSCTYTRLFLAEIWTLLGLEPKAWAENAGVFHLIHDEPGIRNHMKLVPRSYFNEWPRGPGVRTDNVFLVHFPGRKDKWKAVEQFLPQRRNFDG
jgi:hypothetical protein